MSEYENGVYFEVSNGYARVSQNTGGIWVELCRVKVTGIKEVGRMRVGMPEPPIVGRWMDLKWVCACGAEQYYDLEKCSVCKSWKPPFPSYYK